MDTPGQAITPDQAMGFAIETAKLGRGFVSPNPLVGCVIVDRDHKFVAAGAHLNFGGSHAEINALRAAEASQLDGAILYVTLEPCSHHGQTGSCAKALSDLPLAKVVYGTLDPNPMVAGRGIAILQAADIEVEHFSRYEEECQQVCEQFFYHIQNQRPYIAIKIGASLDGKVALESGESQWITGKEARIHGRQLRAHYDATLVGAGTLQYDNPTLDFRGTDYADKKENKIIILDPKGKAAQGFKDTKIFENHPTKNIFVLTRDDHVTKWNCNLVQVIRWEADPSGWQQALKNLYQKGIHSIYVEGGSFVFGQILTYQLAQKIYLFQSAKIIGNGVSWSQYFECNNLSEAPHLKNWRNVSVGEDLLNIAYF